MSEPHPHSPPPKSAMQVALGFDRDVGQDDQAGESDDFHHTFVTKIVQSKLGRSIVAPVGLNSVTVTAPFPTSGA